MKHQLEHSRIMKCVKNIEIEIMHIYQLKTKMHFRENASKLEFYLEFGIFVSCRF